MDNKSQIDFIASIEKGDFDSVKTAIDEQSLSSDDLLDDVIITAAGKGLIAQIEQLQLDEVGSHEILVPAFIRRKMSPPKYSSDQITALHEWTELFPEALKATNSDDVTDVARPIVDDWLNLCGEPEASHCCVTSYYPPLSKVIIELDQFFDCLRFPSEKKKEMIKESCDTLHNTNPKKAEEILKVFGLQENS